MRCMQLPNIGHSSEPKGSTPASRTAHTMFWVTTLSKFPALTAGYLQPLIGGKSMHKTHGRIDGRDLGIIVALDGGDKEVSEGQRFLSGILASVFRHFVGEDLPTFLLKTSPRHHLPPKTPPTQSRFHRLRPVPATVQLLEKQPLGCRYD